MTIFGNSKRLFEIIHLYLNSCIMSSLTTILTQQGGQAQILSNLFSEMNSGVIYKMKIIIIIE